jgi:hypothetical protein
MKIRKTPKHLSGLGHMLLVQSHIMPLLTPKAHKQNM